MKLNKEEIEVAKVLDTLKLNWKRNWKGFPYLTQDGKERKFYPDFVVNDSKYIEYKGWLTDKMRHKMQSAKTLNDLDLTIIVCQDPRYSGDGIQLKTFKNEFKRTGNR